MKEIEYRKQLLLHKIDAHRELMRLELETAKLRLHPMQTLSAISKEAAAYILAPRKLLHALGEHPENMLALLLGLLPLVMPHLIKRRRRRGEQAAGPAA